MKLDNVELRVSANDQQKMKLLRYLPDKKIYDVTNILVMKHKDNYYVLKIRPCYEKDITTKEFVTIRKSDVNYEDIPDLIKRICASYIIFDITGFKLETVQII